METGEVLKDLENLRGLLAGGGFGPVVAHAPYIMNACSKDKGIRELAAEQERDEYEELLAEEEIDD